MSTPSQSRQLLLLQQATLQRARWDAAYICTHDKTAAGRALQVVTVSLLCLPCALVQYLRDRLDKLERELQQEKQYRVKVRAKLGSPPCLGLVSVFCLGPRAPGLTTSNFLHCKVEFMRSAVRAARTVAIPQGGLHVPFWRPVD